MAGAADGVVYLYENVGLQITPSASQSGVAYVYENVGFGPRWSPVLGRVTSDLGPAYGVAYLYENVT